MSERSATSDSAPWTPQATEYWPFKLTMPIMIVRFSSDCVKISGQRKSFQIHVNCSVARTASAGTLSGSAILVKTCHSFAPARMAASRSAFGTVEKKFRISKVQMGMPSAVWTKMIGQRVSIKSSVLKNLNSGIKMTCGGKNIPDTRARNNRLLPRNGSLENTYPPSTPSVRDATVAGTVTSSVFRRYR